MKYDCDMFLTYYHNDDAVDFEFNSLDWCTYIYGNIVFLNENITSLVLPILLLIIAAQYFV